MTVLQTLFPIEGFRLSSAPLLIVLISDDRIDIFIIDPRIDPSRIIDLRIAPPPSVLNDVCRFDAPLASLCPSLSGL
jgi:hypothetical protein